MEILVAISIFMVVAIMSGEFVIMGFRSTTFEAEQETAVRNARRGMEIMVKEIRGANNSERGDYPLAAMEEDNLIYYSDVDDDGYMEKVRYFLDGSLLKKVVTEPGADKSYGGAGATTTISRYVTNKSERIFTYRDSNYAETNNINDVRLINIKLKINVTPERVPNDYDIETDVNLRNLKDNL